MRKSTLLLCAGVGLLVLGNAWLLVQLNDARTSNADLRAQVAAVRAVKSALETTPRPASPAAQSRTGPQESANIQAHAADDVAARMEAARKRHERFDARQRQLMADPEYREALLQQERLQLYARREDAIRLLGFTSAEADGVIDLWAELNLQTQRLRSPSNEGERLERVEQQSALEREFEQNMRKTLGDSKYAQWRDYMGSLPTRATISQLQSQLAGIESLRDEQIEPLVTALRPVSMQYDRDMTEYLQSAGANVPDSIADDLEREEHRVDLVATHNQRMHDAAATILTGRQLATFDAQLKRALETQQAWLQMSRVSLKEGKGTVAKTP
jgi:hypothetical protein